MEYFTGMIRKTLGLQFVHEDDLLDILMIDKVLLLTARSIGGLFSRVKKYFPSKIRGGDAVGNGR